MMNMLLKRDLYNKLKSIDNAVAEFDSDNIENELIENFSVKNIISERKAILGLDIYRYSLYPEEKQNLIPFIFDLIIDLALQNIKEIEESLFSEYEYEFVSTGDGGFIIFDTPLHSLLFNFEFMKVLKLFNTHHYYSKLSNYIGEILVRSVITYDNIYHYNNNYYGKAIITNARILSKDKLNRFLIDNNVYNYFKKYFNGIESLQLITEDDILRVFKIDSERYKSYYFNKNNVSLDEVYVNELIRNIHIQKIDNLLEKLTELSIYNIEVQIISIMVGNYEDVKNKTTRFILTIGNTNLNTLS